MADTRTTTPPDQGFTRVQPPGVVDKPYSTKTGGRQSPDLVTQTPELDGDRVFTLGGLRPFSWARERPAIFFGVLGGAVLAAAGGYIVYRFSSKRPWYARYARYSPSRWF